MSTPPGVGRFGAFAQGSAPTGSGPAGSAFGVDTDLLVAEGKALQEIGGQLPTEAVKLYEPSDGAVAALLGWQTAAALERCTEAWAALLKRFASQLDNAGEKLTAMAANYTSTDTDAQQQFQRLQHGHLASRLELQ